MDPKKNSTYLDKPITGYARKYNDGEVKDVFSFFIDFEWAHFVGKKGKAAIAALLGTFVERYDYALYGYMAVVLSTQFFPSQDPVISLLKSFIGLAIGCLAKPFGSYFFGTIGDKVGRKQALRWSILGIAFPTAMIGCLPSYDEWGWVASALLVVCRLIQGAFVTAEADGVDIFIYETISKDRACLANSFTWMSDSLGCCLASLLAGVALLPQLPSWAWRLPFLLGGVLGLFTFYLRNSLIESYDYAIYKSNETILSHNRSKPFFKALLDNKRNLFLAILLAGSMGGTYIFYLFFWNNFLYRILNITTASEACFQASLLMFVYVIIAPICGYIADTLKILPTLKISSFICLLAIIANAISVVCFNSISMKLMVFTTIAFALFHIPINVLLVKLFPINDRYRCVSMAHALGALIFASSSPMIAIYSWEKFKTPIAPLSYCCFLLLIGFFAVLRIKDKQGLSADAESKITEVLENDSDLVEYSAYTPLEAPLLLVKRESQ